MVFLDSSVVVALLRGERASALAFAEQVASGAPIACSAIVVHELWVGVHRYRQPEVAARLLRGFLSGPVAVEAYTESDAERSARLRAELASRGTPIGPMDTLIAGQVLARGGRLATRNLAEFGRVEGLDLLEWPPAA
jgi:tRNA(fMet)-specific endonuclease VapC